jgi:Ca2+-binding EF-hand superfamily protein
MTPMRKVMATMLVAAFAVPAHAAGDSSMAQSVEKQFRAQDGNKDGKLSPRECADGAKKMFRTMDANKDGKVTASEMDKAHAQITGRESGPSDLSSAEKIRIIDSDENGELTAAEHAEGAKQMFALMDLDTDGYLTRDELMSGHQEMLQKDAQR